MASYLFIIIIICIFCKIKEICYICTKSDVFRGGVMWESEKQGVAEWRGVAWLGLALSVWAVSYGKHVLRRIVLTFLQTTGTRHSDDYKKPISTSGMYYYVPISRLEKPILSLQNGKFGGFNNVGMKWEKEKKRKKR